MQKILKQNQKEEKAMIVLFFNLYKNDSYLKINVKLKKSKILLKIFFKINL
jgi:hypothetical protein